MIATPQQLKIFPFAQILAVVFALLGVLAGLIYAVGGLIYDLAATGSFNTGTALAFLALIGMPALFGLIGWITGVLGAILFNSIPEKCRQFVLKTDIYSQ